MMYKKFKDIFLSAENYIDFSDQFTVGQTVCYIDTILMIIDKRESPAMGLEYQILLEGKTHGWISHSVLKDVTRAMGKSA